MSKQAKFARFDEATKEDVDAIIEHYKSFAKALPARIIQHMKLLDGDFGGFQIDRLQHSLQTATRGYQDERDEEYIVCALLHDIGDTLGTYDHGEVAAAILKPFVSEANQWMLKNHTIFQGYYYFEHIGISRDLREKHQNYPHYEYTKEFIEEYDMPAFDPDYTNMALTEFEPMVRRVLKKS